MRVGSCADVPVVDAQLRPLGAERHPRVAVLVRREDHRAPRLMAVANDAVEHVRRVGSVAEVADLVQDEHMRRDVAPEGVSEQLSRDAAERASMSSAH